MMSVCILSAQAITAGGRLLLQDSFMSMNIFGENHEVVFVQNAKNSNCDGNSLCNIENNGLYKTTATNFCSSLCAVVVLKLNWLCVCWLVAYQKLPFGVVDLFLFFVNALRAQSFLQWGTHCCVHRPDAPVCVPSPFGPVTHGECRLVQRSGWKLQKANPAQSVILPLPLILVSLASLTRAITSKKNVKRNLLNSVLGTRVVDVLFL